MSVQRGENTFNKCCRMVQGGNRKGSKEKDKKGRAEVVQVRNGDTKGEEQLSGRENLIICRLQMYRML